jgi:dermatan 4-sulfotransferase 1
VENHSFIKFVPGVYVIYLSVPKVASSSISYAMLKTQPTAQPELSEHSPEGKALTNWRPAESPHPALPIFTFTREPIKKFFSYYKDKFVRARGTGFELDHLKKLKFDPDMSLEEVVRHMMTIPVEKMEHHAQPQHRILIKNGRLIPDFVGRVEDISTDWPLISQISLCNFLVEHKKNATEDQAESLDLTESVSSALISYYAEDFDIFGYDKPLIKDHSIKVIRPKTIISDDQIDKFQCEIQGQRSNFRALATRLQEDPAFKEKYLGSMRNEFNKFLLFSNSINSEIRSKKKKIARLVKTHFNLRL